MNWDKAGDTPQILYYAPLVIQIKKKAQKARYATTERLNKRKKDTKNGFYYRVPKRLRVLPSPNAMLWLCFTLLFFFFVVFVFACLLFSLYMHEYRYIYVCICICVCV